MHPLSPICRQSQEPLAVNADWGPRSATDLTTVYHFEVSRRAASVFRFPMNLSACDLSTELLNGAGFNSHL